MSLGAYLRQCRMKIIVGKKPCSLRTMAARTGLSIGALCAIESDISMPKFDSAVVIAHCYKTTLAKMADALKNE